MQDACPSIFISYVKFKRVKVFLFLYIWKTLIYIKFNCYMRILMYSKIANLPLPFDATFGVRFAFNWLAKVVLYTHIGFYSILYNLEL